MLKVLIWQVLNNTSFKDKAIKILEEQHNGIEIVGEATTENIAKNDGGSYDLILVVGGFDARWKMEEVRKNAHQFNLPEEKLLGDWIVCIPGFTLEKYRQLQQSRLSIISRGCFGGMISNMLALPFRSPFVDLWLYEKDFNRLLRNPRAYMEEDLVFKSKEYKAYAGFEIATYTCEDVSIVMEHYKDFDEAVRKWNERKKRINWDNLLIVNILEDPELLREFDAMPYDKKVCFVPFKSDLPSAFYIDPNKRTRENTWIWHIVHYALMDKVFYYDPFDMLLYGKKTPLIETLPKQKEQQPVKVSAETKNHFYFLSNLNCDTVYDRQDILSHF